MKNHFDLAAERLRKAPFRAGAFRSNAGQKAAKRYESYPKAAQDNQHIINDGVSIHTSDGVPLFDQDFIRHNADQLGGH